MMRTGAGLQLITFDDVSKAFAGGATAVDRLSLEVPDGKLTVFVGSSGCGKTTALRMINRMIDPTSGTITVDGADVSTVNPVQLRLGIGYVIQNAGLMPHQRVIDNVAAVPVLKGQSRRAARNAAYEVLERVGLDPKVAHALSRATLRWRTTARRRRTSTGRGSADPVDGRAVLCRRSRGPT